MRLKHFLLTIFALLTLTLLFSCGKPAEYTVTFDANGGSEVNTQVIEEGGVAIKPDTPTKEGYTFKGWYKDNIEWSFVGDTVTENILLKAKWEKNKYTVTFDANGGEGGKTETVQHGGTVSAPLPTRANYSFEGWYVGETKWNFKTDKITSDITLVAKWEPFTKTVTFDPGVGATVTEKTRKVKYGEEIGILPTPSLEGWKFLGWYDSDDVNYENRITKEYIVLSSVKLVALWEKTETLDPVEHSWSEWEEYSHATCTEPQKLYRTCDQCNETEYKDGQLSSHSWSDWSTKTEATCYDKEVLYRKCSVCNDIEEKDGISALGHNLTAFNYGMLSHSAYCDRCKTSIVCNYENLASSIKKTTIEGNVIGAENVNCLYNGNWDETSGTFCARGGSITVNIEFEQPTDADIIYVKGKGYYSYSVYVLYEGDSEYTMIGIGSFGSEACRFNLDRKITKISIQMENGGNLDGYWQEVAILKIPENQ